MTDANRKAARVQHYVSTEDSFRFFNLLTILALLDSVEAQLPPHRTRPFPPTETLLMFLAQAMSNDGFCQNVVNQVAT